MDSNHKVIFTCADQFEAMMTCIYEAWSSRLGHSHVALQTEPIGNLQLFCEYRSVKTDFSKAQKVMTAIYKKISFYAYQMIYRAAMSDAEDKLDTIYRFLVAGFHYGPSVVDYLQEPVIMRMFELNRTVLNEAHLHKEFIRFANMEGNVLVSHISPKSNVLTLTAPHFADRMPSENWMIIDDIRSLAIVHPADQDYYLTSLTPTEMTCLSQTEDDPFLSLWKGFFEHISIKERYNPKCQRTHLPLWYRKHMAEFR